jgi:hypothetical protein
VFKRIVGRSDGTEATSSHSDGGRIPGEHISVADKTLSHMISDGTIVRILWSSTVVMMRGAGYHQCRAPRKRGTVVYGNERWLYIARKKLRQKITRGLFGSVDPIPLLLRDEVAQRRTPALISGSCGCVCCVGVCLNCNRETFTRSDCQ